MESAADVVLGVHVSKKILHGLGSVHRIELDHDLAHCRRDDDNRFLLLRRSGEEERANYDEQLHAARLSRAFAKGSPPPENLDQSVARRLNYNMARVWYWIDQLLAASQLAFGARIIWFYFHSQESILEAWFAFLSGFGTIQLARE